MESATQGPLQVFISYAHEDEELRQEFVKHLSQLKRDGLIQDWHDREITAGSEWAGQIDEHLNSANIIVLLVSPDFVASRYCYDIEMKRALERHAAGEARVVPVILRPSDWETSPFAKLNALPKEAKPVVDWPTHDPKLHDHAFLNVVEGLRRVAQEWREPEHRGGAPAPPPLVERPVVRKIRLWRLAVAGGLMVLMIAAGWFWWAWRQRREQERQYVAQGDASLKVGRYEQARAPYQQALRLNPGNAAASFGLDILDLAKLKPDPVAFEQRLNQLLKEAPKDPYLKVLEGDYLAGLGRLDDAMSRYKEAAKLDQGLAEAYFRMGVLYDQRRDIAHALTMYKRAVELAPSSPQYACNLADQYFKHGEYTEGIRVYGGIREFPLAALESAKIYRLLGDLKAANDLERVAIGWMGEPAVAKSPESRLPWSIESGGAQPVSLSTGGAQLCYAHLEFSATLYLDGDEAHAREQSERAARDCGARLGAVKATVRWELERVAQEQGDLAGRATTYSRRFLTE
jgi:tetratricopeptide (TPR) repeat protein